MLCVALLPRVLLFFMRWCLKLWILLLTIQPCVTGCENGSTEPNDAVTDTNPCVGQEDGVLVSLGEPNGCEYPSTCAEKGSSTLINQICQDQRIVDDIQTLSCSRSTEGTLVATSDPGVCQFEATCDITGYTIATQIYCRSGDEVEENLIQYGCRRETNGLSCDDNNICSRSSECLDGACRPTELVDCDDSNPCTDDACDTDLGCIHTQNTASCTDGDACTTNDVCQSGTCVGTPVNCDDDNPCTVGSCIAGEGCVFTTTDAFCDDGNACTADDQCLGGQCRGTTVVTCNDDNPCTNDTCKPSIGCENINNTLSCDDGNACTSNDVCDQGTCQPGEPTLCDDENPCTLDSCEPSAGCINTNQNAECDDENVCTLNDTCIDGQCVGDAEECLEDDNPCTAEFCDPQLGCSSDILDGVVIEVLSSADCQFDNVCDQNGTQSRDVMICRNGELEEERDIAECIRSTDAVACDDGAFCTVDDSCIDGVCTGSVRDCSDGNSCTFDTCSQSAGCQHQDDTNVCSPETIDCQRYVACRDNSLSNEDLENCDSQVTDDGLLLYSSMTQCLANSGCGNDDYDPICALEFCSDTVVACLGPDIEPSGTGSCAELRSCIDACSEDYECRSHCVDATSFSGFELLLDLNECGRLEQCLQLDGSFVESCLEENCAEAYQACSE